MNIARTVALSGTAVLLAALIACGPNGKDTRPDPGSIVAGDRGLESKDLIEMTDKMAPDVLKIPEIYRNPNKIVIVMKPIENRTSNPGEDMTIYVARIRSKLNQNARDRLAFVEDRRTTQALQAQEGRQTVDPFEEGSRTGVMPQPTALQAQYVLYGTFYEKRNNATSFYLCTFRLTNIQSGELVWENSYEVRTLN